MNPCNKMRRCSGMIWLFASLLALGVSVSAAAAEAPGMTQMRVAHQHAVAAAQAARLADIRAQLRQVIDCLQGTGSASTPAKTGEARCTGRGALDDLPSGSANRIRADKALRLSRIAVTFHDYRPAHYTALAVQAVIEEATGK